MMEESKDIDYELNTWKRDTIKLRGGRTFAVSMSYWHWRALEWMTEDIGRPMFSIIDDVEKHLPDFKEDGHNFDYVLRSYIEHYYDAWYYGPMDTRQDYGNA